MTQQQTTPCRSCGHQVAWGAATCPNCGQPKPALIKVSPKAWKGIGYFAIASFVLVIMVKSCSPGEPTDDIWLLRFAWTTDPIGLRFIDGAVYNSSSDSIGAFRVVFDLMDSRGLKTGLAMSEVGGLAAKDSTQFEAIVLPEDAVTAKFARYELIVR
jgi:hypothetical protein